jgi:rare lipoprotein A
MAIFCSALALTFLPGNEAEARFNPDDAIGPVQVQCVDHSQDSASQLDFVNPIVQALNDSNFNPDDFALVLEDGTEIRLQDLQAEDEEDLSQELKANPQLAALLASASADDDNDVADSGEYEIAENSRTYPAPSRHTTKKRTSSRSRHASRRKAPHYTNRGILPPSGRWPVAKGKCATLKGRASYYGGGEKLKRNTASGRRFNPNVIAAANRTLPMGARVQVKNLKNGKVLGNVVINDRGPAIETGRMLDLTKGAARKLGFIQAGETTVEVRVCRGS